MESRFQASPIADFKAKGVDARLLWFPDENHWVLKPRNSKLWYGEFFDLLKAHDASAVRRKAAR